MLNDFEIPWHEFFRRYWWVAPPYPNDPNGVFCAEEGILRDAQNKKWGFCVEEQQFWYYNGKHKKAHSGEELTVFC